MVVVLAFGLALTGVLVLPNWMVGLSLNGAHINVTERLRAISDARGTILQAITGIALGLGAYATWRRLTINEHELRTSREGQITERYSRAIDHLGHDSMDVRMGGIFALGRLADNSPADRDAIVAVLCAFVRGHSSWPPTQPGQAPAGTPRADLATLAVRANDVQAALTTLGRINQLPGDEWISLPRTDLRFARMDGLRFDHANLGNAELSLCRLRGTVLRHSVLYRSRLRQAQLHGADLTSANLEGADLTGARADATTRWPDGFDPLAAGVLLE